MMTDGIRPEVAALLKRTRTDRGLPEKITDPLVIAKIATIVRYATGRDGR